MWNFSKFGHVYWRNPSWKTTVFVQCVQWFISLKGPLKQPKAALKIMKNAFYFTLKSYFFFKIFKFLSFCPDVYVENGLIKKLLVSKIVTSQTGKQIISIHKLSNVSKSIGNQIMTFGQFIEHNMRNIFLKKSVLVENTIPRPISENQNWAYLGINSPKCYIGYSYSMSKLKTTKIYCISLTTCWPLAFPSYRVLF